MSGDAIQHHILSVLVQNRPGVLARVAGLFARRGFNIFSLAVAPSEHEGMSRITIVVDVESAPARAGDQATVQAHRGRQDLRARPPTIGRTGVAPRDGARRSRRAQPGARAGDDLRRQGPRRCLRGADPQPRGLARQARRLRATARQLRDRRAATNRQGGTAQARPSSNRQARPRPARSKERLASSQ